MAARRTSGFEIRPCQICGAERYLDEVDTCYCQDCRDICRRLAARKDIDPDDLPDEVYAERHADLAAHAARITAELEAGAA